MANYNILTVTTG